MQFVLRQVQALRQFLDRPNLRELWLRAAVLRDDDVNQLTKVSDWFRQLERVELFANNPGHSAAPRLSAWLASDPSLRPVQWRGRWLSRSSVRKKCSPFAPRVDRHSRSECPTLISSDRS